MEVEFTSFREPTSVAMRMLRGPWFLRRFAGTWLFRPSAAGGTDVTFRYSFTVRGWWLPPLLAPILGWMFGRDVGARLHGLKRGAEEDGLLERLSAPRQ